MNDLKEYQFTDEQMEFILEAVRDCLDYDIYEDCQEWIKDLINQIEDKLDYKTINSPTND